MNDGLGRRNFLYAETFHICCTDVKQTSPCSTSGDTSLIDYVDRVLYTRRRRRGPSGGDVYRIRRTNGVLQSALLHPISYSNVPDTDRKPSLRCMCTETDGKPGDRGEQCRRSTVNRKAYRTGLDSNIRIQHMVVFQHITKHQSSTGMQLHSLSGINFIPAAQ